MDVGTLTVTMGANTAGLARAQQAMIQLQQQTIKSVTAMNASLNTLSQQMLKTGTQAKVAEASITSSFTNITTSLNSVSQRFRTFGYLASMALTAPIVLAAKSVFNMAKDYEYSMQKVVGLTGASQEEVNGLGKEIMKLGPAIGKSPKELADALYFIESSAFRGQKALDVLTLSAKASTAGLGETQSIAMFTVAAMNAYAGSSLTAAKAVDILISGVRESLVEASSFTSAIGSVINVASSLGVSLDQLVGGLATITLTGATAANAATYLRGVFNNLLKGSDDLGKGADALKALGTNYSELRHILRDQGLVPLLQKLNDMSAVYGETLYSKVFPNIRATLGVLGMAGKNFQYNSEAMKRVTESAGSLSAAFAAVSDTIKIRYDRAISQSNVSMISLGKTVASSFLPMLESLVGKLDRLAKWFDTLSEAQQKHKLTQLAWLAAAGPISLAIAVIGYAISGLISVLSGLWATLKYGRLIVLAWTGSLEAAAAATTMNATLTTALLNPYVLALAAVAALAGGYFLLKNRIEEATAASEREKAFREGEKNAKISMTGIMEKQGLIPTMDSGQLNAYRDASNQELVILKEDRLKLAILRQKWIEEDKKYAILKNTVTSSETFLKTLQGGGYTNMGVMNATARVAKDKEALLKYVQDYNSALDTSSSSLENQVTGIVGLVKQINDTIKNLPVDPILAQMEQEKVATEKIILRNNAIQEILTSVQDEIKYTDSLAFTMNKLGLEYNATGAKADIYLEAIQKLTKEGLPQNSAEIQAQIKNYQDLRKAFMDANPAIQKVNAPAQGELISSSYLKASGNAGGNSLRGIGMTLGGEYLTDPKAMNKYMDQVKRAMIETQHLTDVMAYQRIVVGTLQNGFELLFEGGGKGFQNFVDSMIKGFERLMAKIMALIVAYIILDIVSGGTTALAGFAKSVMGNGGMGDFIKMGFGFGKGMANGGVVPAGYPNDSYHAMLTSGEMVTPPGKLNAGMFSSDEKQLIAVVTGDQLNFILSKRNRKINSYR